MCAACLYAGVEVRGVQLSWSRSPPIPLKQGLSLNLELNFSLQAPVILSLAHSSGIMGMGMTIPASFMWLLGI